MSSEAIVTIWDKSKAWFTLARPQFLSVGVLPFILGFIMARHDEGFFHWALFGWGVLSVILIMLSTYWAGECFDYQEDRISGEIGRSRFAGGTGVIQSGFVSRRDSFIGSVVALSLAGIVGLIIWVGYGTGPLTIPLGLIGMIGGFLYSTPPVRWVSTGIGEIWIALCYGFLPVMTGYYLPTGRFDYLTFFVPIPIAASIFNVILANEFPDYVSDLSAGKQNFLVRFGRVRGAQIYAAASLIMWLGVVVSVFVGVPATILAYSLPSSLAALFVSIRMLQGKWENRRELEVLCGLSIFVNLGTSLAYILAIYWS